MSAYKKQMSKAVQTQLHRYSLWLAKNPKLSKELELGLKLSSYLLIHAVDKGGSSDAVHQMVYCVSDLLSFLNDFALSRAYPHSKLPFGNNIRTWLTIVEYSEVCLELGAEKTWGAKGKWTAVCLVQAFKCAARLCLLMRNDEGLLPYPPIQPLKREAMDVDLIVESSSAIKLKSGAVIRRVDSGPPFSNDYQNLLREHYKYTFKGSAFVGEVLYVLKPLIHLWAMKHSGRSSWTQWLTSLAIDGISIKLLWSDYSRKKFSRELEWQYLARLVSLVVYLLRSPFYDAHLKSVILAILYGLRKVLPFMKFFFDPLIDFLPAWHETYFYLWSH